MLDSTYRRDLTFADKDCCNVVFQNDRWALIVSNLEHNCFQSQQCGSQLYQSVKFGLGGASRYDLLQ